MKPVAYPVVTVLLSLLCLPLQAVEVIEGVTATASSFFGPTVSPANLVNNSGIRTSGSVPGNETPTSYDVTAVHTYHRQANDQWHTAAGDPTPTVTFNLGGAYDLDAIHIWNGNQYGVNNGIITDLTARGVQQFDMLVSTDGTNFTEVLTDQVLTESPDATYVAAQMFDLTGNDGITHVRLKVDSNYGNAYTGLSEVMFTYAIDPDLEAPTSFDFGTISFVDTLQLGIPVSNAGATQTLNISGVTIAGVDASSFTVDGFPTTLAANGGSGTIDVTFDPDGFDGPFQAVLEITSDHGGTPGTITEVSLVANAEPDPQISVPAAVNFGWILPGATTQALIPVENLGLTQSLAISGVALSGAGASSFTIDSFPASIAASGADTIAVTFNPGGSEGDYAATLEITCNDAGVPGTVVTVNLSAGTNLLAPLANPAITAAAQAFSGTFPAGNLFDGTVNEYVTLAGGAGTPFSQSDGTWVELDFGAPVTLDRMVLISRTSTTVSTDLIGESRLILSNDATFDANDTIHTFAVTGQNGHAPIHSFPPTTARYARWEVSTSLGTTQNLGGMELRFLGTPAGWFQAPLTVIGGATAFSAVFALDNAADGDAGRGAGTSPAQVEYASAGRGVNTFVDFDFGSSLPIVGFDWFDRINDRTTAFDLLLSDDPTFASGVTTLSYTPGSTGWGLRRSFPEVTARYARFDATAVNAANAGMQEIIFYSSAETPAGTPFEQYITTTWGLTGTDADPDFDYDGDGLPNAIEFVLGSDPTTADPTAAPTGTLDATHLTFTFRRSSAAAADNPHAQYGSDLAGWTTAADGENGISITTTPDGFGPGIDSVTVLIPRALALDGQLFARLAVSVAVTP